VEVCHFVFLGSFLQLNACVTLPPNSNQHDIPLLELKFENVLACSPATLPVQKSAISNRTTRSQSEVGFSDTEEITFEV
jgi:hypothetical protein